MTHPEMTLRDWFAGQALTSGSDGLTIEEAAERAYRIADAMLAAREPQKPKPVPEPECQHRFVRSVTDDGFECRRCGMSRTAYEINRWKAGL